METFVIYEDKDTKIEILKPFHDLLEDQKVKWLELSYMAKDYLYGIVLDEVNLKARRWNCSERLSAGTIPIIEPGRPIALVSPFDVFNRALSIISYGMLQLEFNQEEVKAQIQESIQDEDFDIICGFFKERLFKIDGYLVYHKNNTLLILLFSLQEE